MPTTFTATKAGPLSDGDTFGNTSPGVKGTDWPAETDYLATGGQALTQGTATQVALMTGGGTLTLTGSFTCPDVQNVRFIVPNGVTSTISFGTTGVNPGGVYSLTGTQKAIEVKSGGTLTDVTGSLTISGLGGYGVYNAGTVTDFSGVLSNSGGGYGAANANTWTNFSGVLNNSGAGWGASNAGEWGDFTGTLTNTGTGIAADNSGVTWTAFTGILELGSMASTAIDGDAIPFSGIIRIKAQADLDTGNIKTGKTILGVAGSLTVYTYGDNDAAKVLNTAAAPGTDIGAVAGAAAQLVTDKAAVTAKAADIRDGTTILGVTGMMGTAVSSMAGMLT